MIRFSKYIWVYILISSLVLVPGFYSLLRYGLKPAVDFTGGTLLELKFKKPIDQQIFNSLNDDKKLALSSIQKSADTSYILRFKAEENTLGQYQKEIASAAGENPIIMRNETVGPVLGKELLNKTVTASLLAMIVILLYVAYAFKNIKYGISAIVALIHDLLVVVSIFSLLGKWYGVEVDTLFVTAVLTTMSFSVHDTIVVFDRIRELVKKQGHQDFEQVSDQALTETMSRSLTNSFTIVFMLLALVLLGGTTVRWFAVALLIGTISGTYSSPFVATPVLIFWQRWEKKKGKR